MVLEFLKILAFLVLVSYKPVSYKKNVYTLFIDYFIGSAHDTIAFVQNEASMQG